MRIEHANITVPDIDAARDFLTTIFPDLEVMHEATAPTGVRWMHLGVNGSYLALESPHDNTRSATLNPRYQNYGINHLGLIVEDMDAAKAGWRPRAITKGISRKSRTRVSGGISTIARAWNGSWWNIFLTIRQKGTVTAHEGIPRGHWAGRGCVSSFLR